MTTITRFEQLALAPSVLQAIQEVGYETPTPIQAACIPHLLNGNDVLGQAQTGTGKTAAFALPLLSHINIGQLHPQILVLTPTRELAIQVAEAFQAYARHLTGFHVLPIYGGQSMSTQLRQLKRGVHVVIGTPGRIMDHLRRKSLSLTSLKSLVLDEADEMLKMGFLEDVDWILEHTPAQRQIALFSATMPAAIQKVAGRHLNNPQVVKIKSNTATVTTIDQFYWQVSGTNKLDALTRILESEDFDAVIVFVRTKTVSSELAEKLEARGFATAAINGDMTQVQRERTIEQLKSKKLDIVVATDVAARGLDVKRITHVINYDIPHDTEAYVHRIGRTGRAGRSGKAILFVAPREKRMLYVIEKATKQPIKQMHLPSGESVTQRRVAQFKQHIIDAVAGEDLLFFEQIIEQLQTENDITPTQCAAALAFLNQRERPIQSKAKESADKPVSSKTHVGNKLDARPSQSSSRKSGPSKTDTRNEIVRYRLEVGHRHGATANDIVGAIANEAGIESQFIGRVKIYDDFSTIELPPGMPKDTFYHLKKVRIRECKLDISLDMEKSDKQKQSRQKQSRQKQSGQGSGKKKFHANRNGVRTRGHDKSASIPAHMN